MSEPVIIGNCTLYNADCRDILPGLSGIDAVVTDPPYGIGADGTMHKKGGQQYGVAMAAKRVYPKTDWDNAPSQAELMDAIRAASKHQIIFGGNYYVLPPTSCWLVWDKLTNGDFADCELIWTNLRKAVRRLVYRWNGMLRENKEPRGDHPTQKPIGVMRWCIGHLPKGANVILDPFMGSGTTGIAAVLEGRSFIGIEREKQYFDIACKRIEEAQREPEKFEKYIAKGKNAADRAA